MTTEPDGQSKTLLLAYIRRVKALADEIGGLQEDMAEVCREAKGAGFETKRIREVVRWLRRVDRDGRDKVDEAEAIFDLYRTVATGGATKLDAMMDSARDRTLLKIFAPDDQTDRAVSRRRKGVASALALAAASKAARSA